MTVGAFDYDMTERLERFLTSKFTTIDRASELLSIPVSTLYSYLDSTGKKREKGTSFVYPSIPFLKKLADWNLNLHWLITGYGEMEIDFIEIGAPGLDGRKQRASQLLAEAGIDDSAALAYELNAVKGLRLLREYFREYRPEKVAEPKAE